MVGSFLVSQALAEGRPLAVLARNKGPIPAAKRLPEGLKILEGDLTEPNLGLSREDLSWLKTHCKHVIHAGASVRFALDEKSGEPYRSNIDGTRYILALCQQLEIRNLAFVSTAYVCGDRTGTIAEAELDEGQGFNNPYERSKLIAECLVNQASFLDKLHIFRPSVVVGDSQTGEIPAFHTIYELLRFAWTASGLSVQELLDLVGLDRKTAINMVPANWVAAAIWLGVQEPVRRKTFHLTHPHPVELGDLLDCLDLLRPDSKGLSSAGIVESPSFQPLLGYMRQHPVFESSVGLKAPEMNRETLTKLLDYAVQRKFVAPRVRVELADALGSVTQVQEPCQLLVDCFEKGKTYWNFDERRVRRVEPSDCPAKAYLNAEVFEKLLNRETHLKSALLNGSISLESDEMEETENHLRTLVQHIGVPS